MKYYIYTNGLGESGYPIYTYFSTDPFLKRKQRYFLITFDLKTAEIFSSKEEAFKIIKELMEPYNFVENIIEMPFSCLSEDEALIKETIR